ncbi:hypothetical protein RI129_012351 [Pyrocoelia pectoralis]|uniref:DNA-directed RNA polymerase subunit n=1 Tax=Pyrocoelia pectoralis TaxID=417401 RepID=A0AAN7V3M2_9COLE
MFYSNKNDMMRVKHYDPQSIEFSLFTNEDIKKLSVTKISTPLTFDALGYPLPAGLYDRCMGPLNANSEPCRTCNKNFNYCPGHFGHIELPLPVVNPIFHKTLASILKISCLNCFHIQIPSQIKYCLWLQIKLLNHGLTSEAIDIEGKIQNELSNPSNKIFTRLDEIKEYEKLMENSTVQLRDRVMNNKNTEALRNELINSKVKLVVGKTCMHCGKVLSKIQAARNRIVISTSFTEGGVKSNRPKYMTPEESKHYLQQIWENEKDFLQEVVPVLANLKVPYPTDTFYFNVIPVTPPNARPANTLQGRVVESVQSQIYKDILNNSILLRTIIQVVHNKGDLDVLSIEARGMYTTAQGATSIEKLNYGWENLQANIDSLIDHTRDKGSGEGLKQIIEKKAGLIRMHMMGKRVNFSARSVITPDPNLNIDEIGVPEEFAKHLTYPVPVTPWNVTELRKIIINGPNTHPGAVQVEFEDGTIRKINPLDARQQESIVKRLLTPDDKEKKFCGVKKVHRHLCNGDVLLLNRQPTLHKPSIMAHTARILKSEKTLRLHYANCKAYNADFDGDEMNAHFPQNELARSEGYNIAHVCNQYLVPKDGTPLSGLIQDHVISGVRLSMRGRFFSRQDYQQLVCQAISFKTDNIVILPPSILKPFPLWTGKQVLSTVILNVIPRDRQAINLMSVAKINAKAWQSNTPRKWKAGGTPFVNDSEMSEGEVIIRRGELLLGVLDKTHYGATPFGLVHCIYELYGGNYATKLLSSFAKLFTFFLQHDGFTLGVHDILVQDDADKKRRKIIRNLRKIGNSVMTVALDLAKNSETMDIVKTAEHATAHNLNIKAIIDREYKTVLDPFTNDINKACLPAGLICRFPYNNLQLMVQSGAKGSTVNTMQISCLLGQIELEGKRPPVMISGKTLPSFPIFEFTPRAGGFIDGRFMTGIQPQEFFFHCMAGREGLIDTAVKTSRSGYLQRCLIKHLEGLTVGYDLTVRDSDQCVIQFLYGEDGMDVTKTQFLNEKQIHFLKENCGAIIDKDVVKQMEKHVAEINALIDEQTLWRSKHGDALEKRRHSPFTLFSTTVKDKIDLKNTNKLSARTGRSKLTKHIIKLWQNADCDLKVGFTKFCERSPNPLNSIKQPDVAFGSLSDQLQSLMFKHSYFHKKKDKEFRRMLRFKAMQSLCAPGEPVGLLAAQSIGEPSTQMTLNTFHFAGRGEMNVTLGIPRLREILMMASKNLKTPSMEIPFLNVPNLDRRVKHLKKMLTRVAVSDVLEKIDVVAQLETQPLRQMSYRLKFYFLPYELYHSKYNIKPKGVLKHMAKKFFAQMFTLLRKHTKMITNLPLTHKKLDLTSILKEVASKSVIFETPNIKRAITYIKDNRLILRTDGINITEMFKYNNLLDLNNLYSNDIHKFSETYGIEAATKVIVKEVQEVFKVYGITVDPRHLLLIADYMMFNGTFEPLSRKGLSSSSSPLQQMSFEASLNFLKQATLNGSFESSLFSSDKHYFFF